MAYQIIKSNGSLLVELADGFTDKVSSSITFVGKNVSKFGEIQNDNFLHLLENFANNTAPANKLTGQLWFDTTTSTNLLKVYNGDHWQNLAAISYAPTSVEASAQSNFWFDSNNNQLYVNTGTSFTLVGPEKAPGFNPTRFVSLTLLDSADQPHPVIECLIDDEIIYVISGDDFILSPSNPISGITHIRRGITFKGGEYPDSGVTLMGSSKFATNSEFLRDEAGNYISASSLNIPNTVVHRSGTGAIEVSTVVTSNLEGTPNGLIIGNWSINDMLIPNGNGVAALGTNSLRWSNVYAQTVDTTLLTANVSTFVQLKDKNLRYIDQFDNDTTLSADSEFRLPTQYAVKYYIDHKHSDIQNEIDSLPPASIPAVANTLLKRDASASGFVNTLTATTISLTGSPATKITGFDPDPTLAADSDLRLATQKAIKEYIRNVIELEIANRVAGDLNLQNEINALQAIPSGTVFYTAGLAVPAGYFAADGKAYSKTLYSNLYNALGGTASPYGQTLTTFNVPDLRGEFIRGWDAAGGTARNLDTGRALGSTQADMFGAHNHGMPGDDQLGYANGYAGWTARTRGAFPYDAESQYGGGAQVWSTTDEGGTETRPKNVALQAIIKY